MNGKSRSKATTQQRANGLDEENWLVKKVPYTRDYPLLGFLQLCADRRFHSLLQNEFQKDAKLKRPTDYWIHADAGGTPKMRNRIIAPDYCYNQKKVRLMGWSAHGAGCGGFGEHVPDDIIRRALEKTFKIQRRRYPKAKHYCYFVTIKKKGKAEETVVYSIKSV